MTERLFVLASDFRNCMAFAREQGMAPHEVVFAGGAQSLRGKRGPANVLVRYGDWFEHPQAEAIIAAATDRGFTVR